MAAPYVRQARGVFTGTVGSTDLAAGDAVYFDGTDWEKADADDNTKYAEAIATNAFSSGDVGSFCTSCIVVDTDAPYTQGDQYYLSETAGAVTATRPTTAASLRQVLGFGLSTSELKMDVPPVRELPLSYKFDYGTGDGGQLDSGDFLSARLDAQNEDIGATFAMPQNAVGLEIAYLYLAAEATAGTPTCDITVSGAADGEQWDATTADSTLANQTAEGAAADEIHRIDVTTGFDAAGVLQPDNVIGFHILKDDAGTDATYYLDLHVVWLVV